MMWHGKNFRGFLHHALQVLFDNTGTTLSSTNVEDAIKEVDGNLSAKQSVIKHIDVDINNLTIGASGYVNISSYFPSSIPYNKLLGTKLWSFSGNAVAMNVTGSGEYVIGNANQTLTSIKVRYFYFD